MAQMGPMGFPPGGPGPGIPPMPGPPGGDPLAADSLAAMGALGGKPGGANPTDAVQKVDEALGLAHRLVMSVLPQISQYNPSVARDLHQIAQRILSVKVDVQKEMPISPPPELLMGEGGGPMGAPPPGMGPMGM